MFLLSKALAGKRMQESYCTLACLQETCCTGMLAGTCCPLAWLQESTEIGKELPLTTYRRSGGRSVQTGTTPGRWAGSGSWRT
jgi:hypothetical protein